MAPWLVILVVTFVFGTLMNLLAQYAEGGFKRMVERYKAQPLSVLAPYIGFAIPGVIVALFARFAGNGSQALGMASAIVIGGTCFCALAIRVSGHSLREVWRRRKGVLGTNLAALYVLVTIVSFIYTALIPGFG
jgi:hypothetical protein